MTAFRRPPHRHRFRRAARACSPPSATTPSTHLWMRRCPPAIRVAPMRELAIPAAASEREALAELRALARRNRVRRSMIGLGYYDTITPAVIQRNVLENPSWYTAYTPYQPEISQGRLEALINFQTMVSDLTGLATANASMLDEGTAVVEGMLLARRASGSASNVFLVDADALPQTKALLAHRAEAVGIELVEVDSTSPPADLPEAFGAFIQYPGASGSRLGPVAPSSPRCTAQGGLAVVAADLLALTLLELAGRARRGCRRRHVAALRRADGLRRTARRLHGRARRPRAPAARTPRRRLAGRRRPPRLPALAADARAAHPPREGDEQHLHRAGAARRHGVDVRRLPRRRGPASGSRDRVHGSTRLFADALGAAGSSSCSADFFDTLTRARARPRGRVVAARARARHQPAAASTTTPSRLPSTRSSAARRRTHGLAAAFGVADVDWLGFQPATSMPAELVRTSRYLTHPVFNTHRSETA